MTREKKMDGGVDRRGEEGRCLTSCVIIFLSLHFFTHVQIFKLAKIVTQVVPSSPASTSTNSPIAFI